MRHLNCCLWIDMLVDIYDIIHWFLPVALADLSLH
jgi:hypothetical protein